MNKKRVLSVILSALLLASAIGPMSVSAEASALPENGYCATVEDFRGNGEFAVPTCENPDLVFAGWYTDETYKTPIAESYVEGPAYAKFVGKNVQTVKLQLDEGATTMSENTDVRVIVAVDSLNYSLIKFVTTWQDKPLTKEVTTVYDTLYAYEEAKSAEDVFGTGAAHFAAVRYADLTAQKFYNESMDFAVELTTADGTVITYNRDEKIKDGLTVAEAVITDETSAEDWNVRFLMPANGFVYGPDGLGTNLWNTSNMGNTSWDMTALEGGVYLNNELKSGLTVTKLSDTYYMVCLRRTNSTPEDNMVVKIDGTFTDKNGYYSMKMGPVSFVYDKETAQWAMYNVELNVHSQADTEEGYAVNEIKLLPDKSDKLEGTWNYYAPLWGGITIDGEAYAGNGGSVLKAGGYAYLLFPSSHNVTVGSKAVIDCVVGTTAYAVRINKCELYYKGEDQGWKAPIEPDVELTLEHMTNVMNNHQYKSPELALNFAEEITGGMYDCVQGGIYVEGSEKPVTLPLFITGKYAYNFPAARAGMVGEADTMTAYNFVPTDGMKVVFNGVWKQRDGEATFGVSGFKMIYLNGEWAHYIKEFATEVGPVVQFYSNYTGLELRLGTAPNRDIVLPEGFRNVRLYSINGGFKLNNTSYNNTWKEGSITPLAGTKGCYFTVAEIQAIFSETAGVVEDGTLFTIQGVFSGADHEDGMLIDVTFKYTSTEGWVAQ